MGVDVNTKPSGEASDDAVEALRQERNDLQDRLLRTAAEFDNYRKRTERERRERSDAVSADLIRDLLPVVDDLERALAAAADSADDVLRSGVEPFASVGEQFDPSWHEALSSEHAPGRSDGEVIAEIRRGYRLGTRLLRPALVKVARA